MNTAAKLRNSNDNTEINNFDVCENLHPRVLSGVNGTVAGVHALSESLKRTDAYLRAQQRLNELCLGKEISHV